MDYRLIGSGCVGFLVGAGLVALWPETPAVADGPDRAGTVAGRKFDRAPTGTNGAGEPSSRRGRAALGELMNEPAAGAAELERYLQERGRSRESLIAAGLLMGDHDLLREAAERFPDDPHVQFLTISNELFPDQQRAWIERFKKSQPDNSLAAYFMAEELFKAGDSAAAIEELRAGVALNNFRDFSIEGMMAMEAASLDLGNDGLKAKLQSTFGLQLSYLQRFRDTVGRLEAAGASAPTRQEASELAALGVAIGNDLSQGSGSHLLINQLVGMGIEMKFLEQLDPDGEYEYFNGTPSALMAEIEADTERIREGARYSELAMDLEEPLMLHYLERVRLSGEAAAIEWIKARTDAAAGR